ncbi:hypothetical protein [Roseovarius phycicola]|uniref:Uncharacterized protein n=1 Tax=Roseovarius phycicola TaxID=3080976 RepID=A0ABZ2HH14_9RHOB
MRIDTAEPHRLRQSFYRTSDLGVAELNTKPYVAAVLQGYCLKARDGAGICGVPNVGQGNVAPNQTNFNAETAPHDQLLSWTGRETSVAVLQNSNKVWAIQTRCGVPRQDRI